MMVQEVITLNQQKRYLLLDDEGQIIVEAAKFLKYKDNSGAARNTLRSYAYRLKLFFEFLCQKQLHFGDIGVDEIAEFIQWLRNPHLELLTIADIFITFGTMPSGTQKLWN